MPAYPIVSAAYLEPVPSRGPFGAGKKRRNADELPRLGAHQVRVFRVDGQYIVDYGDLPPDNDQIVRASHVSVVDVSVGVPVVAELRIPSAEASDFTIRVSFACTVTDPARMVRENVAAQPAIEAYMRRHHKINQLGQQFRIAEINQIRRKISGRVRAYTEVKPPEIPGLRVVLNGVEVLTPAELAAFEKARREAHAAHVLESEKQGYTHDLEFDRQRHTQRLADSQRQARHAAAEEDQEQAHLAAARDERHKRMLRAEEMEFARREVEHAVESIGGDPYRALVYAQSIGEINAKELAERITQDRERELEWERQDLDRVHEVRRRDLEWDREDRIRRQREDREDWLRDRQEAREDRLRDRQEAREDQARQLNLKIDLIRELAKRGYLDLMNIRLEGLLEEISGMPPNALTNSERSDEGLPGTKDRVPIETSGDRPNKESGDGEERETGGHRDDGDAIDLDVDAIDLDVEVREEDD
jgi:hypothetical protein